PSTPFTTTPTLVSWKVRDNRKQRRLREPQMAKKRWHDLSPRTRQVMVAAAAIEGALKVAALIDLKQRPAEQIRGSKKTWAATITLVNSAGAVPVAYFLKGRR